MSTTTEEPKSVVEIVAEYSHDVDTALLRFHNRTEWEPSTEETPLDSVISDERPPQHFERLTDEQLREKLAGFATLQAETVLDRADIIALLHGFEQTERAVQRETVTRTFHYFSADGIHPASVLKRVFALGSHMIISPYCDLNLRERGLMLGESHGAQHWRTERICVDVLRRRGDKSWKGPGQKTQASRGTYSRTAAGNQNRRKKKISVKHNPNKSSKNGKHRHK